MSSPILGPSSFLKSAIIFLALALMAPFARAGVTCLGGLSGPFYVPPPPVTTIPPDMPVGSWVGGYTIYVGNTNGLSCTAAFSSPLSMQAAAQIPGGQTMVVGGASYTVYPTGVPGLGVVLFFTAYLNNTAYPELAMSGFQNYIVGGTRSFGLTYTKSEGAKIRARYVKTGPIAGGTYSLSSAQIMDVMPVTDNSMYHTQIYFTTSASLIVNVPTCTTSNQTVSMGSRAANAFTGIGSLAPTVSFSVPLNCQAGINSITYSISAASGIIGSATNGVLQLSSGSSATGVGIRLADASGNAIAFGNSYGFASYTGAAGNFTVPLTASYIQTNAQVIAGTVNAAAIITFLYQ